MTARCGTFTLHERCEAFALAFPGRKASWPYVGQENGRDVLYATWVIGVDYRNRSTLYGAYPNGYLDRLFALFPDVMQMSVFEGKPVLLHAYSGSLRADTRWLRVDVNPDRRPDICGSIYEVAALTPLRFRLTCADPPYEKADAEIYGTAACDRYRATEALAQVTEPGGHLAWLDTCWPMHTKASWLTVGRITVIRSTQHRVRLLTLFERTETMA